MVIILHYLFIFLLYLPLSLSSSEVANFREVSNNRNVTFFLSTPKSGSNLITGCLTAITRKPISWFYWGDTILDPSSEYRRHISYNRLNLNLISDIPLLYRTHYQFAELMQVPSDLNKLIFATRNPKELIYRKFFLEASISENPGTEFIIDFLGKYLNAFEVYEAWHPDNRMIVFYEDFIVNSDAILVKLLQFMEEQPSYLEDFLNHKQEYLSQLLQSYTNQHTHNNGGASSKEGPLPKYYTRKASPETLTFIDEYLRRNASQIWEKHLNRYKETE